ncbi:hypothetical protein [Streptomyces sp. NPDC057939]|uniref:hypothetical protein n=1 Tax=Streptomyces sp. NPDC057939 TaxID=3346284 RepID=UPI0036ED012D
MTDPGDRPGRTPGATDSRYGPGPAVHRLAWLTASGLSAVLVVVAVALRLPVAGSPRPVVVQGGSEGRPVTAVEIVGGGADVGVTPAGDREVTYRARITRASSAPTVEENRLGGTLRLTPHCPGEDSGCSAQLLVTVPRDVPVKVSGGSGRVSLSGLDGAVDAEVTSGSLTLTGLRGPLRAAVGSGILRAGALGSARVEVRTGSGRGEVEFVVPPERVTGYAGSGRLDITVPASSRFRVACRTGEGRCEVDAALGDPGSAHSLDLTAGSGRVRAGPPTP